jgi:hypothetical protein
MRYFNALTDAYFKTDKDGRTVFFPWGFLGRGYTLASDEETQRLRRQIKSYIIVSMVLVVAVMVPLGLLSGLAVGVPFVLFYLVWMFYLLRRLQRSDERMSMKEGLQAQASGYNNPIFLWLMDIVSLAFVVSGVVIVIVEPGEWPMALLTVAMFGSCAAFFTRLLILRRRTAAH